MLKLDYSKVRFDTEIGFGGLGTVYPYQADENGQSFVVKHLYAKNINALLNMVQEIVIGFSCNHSSLISVTGYFIEPVKPTGFNVFIKMPKMRENLNDFINVQVRNKVEKVPEEIVIKCLHDMLSALEYLGKKKIAHRDIKPTNLLLDDSGNMKLSAIGSTTFIDDEDKLDLISQQVGSTFYMAPEVLANPQSVKKEDLYSADIWSMGLIIAELCLLQTRLINPHEYPKEPIVQDILNKIKAKYSQKLVDVLTEMLQVDPNLRKKSAKELREILEKSFFVNEKIKENSSYSTIPRESFDKISVDTLMMSTFEETKFEGNNVKEKKEIQAKPLKSQLLQVFKTDMIEYQPKESEAYLNSANWEKSELNKKIV